MTQLKLFYCVFFRISSYSTVFCFILLYSIESDVLSVTQLKLLQVLERGSVCPVWVNICMVHLLLGNAVLPLLIKFA